MPGEQVIKIQTDALDTLRTMRTKTGQMGSAMKDSAMAKVEKSMAVVGTAMKPKNMLNTMGKGALVGAKAIKRQFLGGFGIATMIRQSQIFTASMGAVFQVIGAMIDTILAPLAPVIARGISFFATHGIKTAKGIGALLDGSNWKSWFESLANNIPKIIGTFVKIAIPIANLVIGLVKFVKDILGAGGIWAAVEVLVDKIWSGLTRMKDFLSEMIGDLFNKLVPDWLKSIFNKDWLDFFQKKDPKPREWETRAPDMMKLDFQPKNCNTYSRKFKNRSRISKRYIFRFS